MRAAAADGVRAAVADGCCFLDDSTSPRAGVAAAREGVALGVAAAAEETWEEEEWGGRLGEGDGGRLFSSVHGRARLPPLPTLHAGLHIDCDCACKGSKTSAASCSREASRGKRGGEEEDTIGARGTISLGKEREE